MNSLEFTATDPRQARLARSCVSRHKMAVGKQQSTPMKIDFDQHSGLLSIAAYGPGWIRVRDTRIEAPCVVTPTDIHTDMLPTAFDQLDAGHFEQMAALRPEIILIGSGSRQRFVDHARSVQMAAAGVALESMDTGAACRMFNILVSEDRAVIAALYML
ncbi:MAG: hypothetical protein IPM80_21670 [Proteobacteria bacterium]|nr:hypothetical protein [Pseudomonadota bacterium]